MKLVPLLVLLLITTNQATAWWSTPYGYTPTYSGYWPNAWPAYGQTPYGYNGSGYNNPGWNVRGSMTASGDTHFIMEYHGNIYDEFYGQGYRQPYYNGFPGYSNYGQGWRR